MEFKPFDPVANNQDDKPAKKVFIAYLKDNGYTEVIENPNKYGIDILATHSNGELHKYDVEVKHGWKVKYFNWSTVHVPERKRKFAEPNNQFFVVMNEQLKYAYVATGAKYLEAEQIVLDTWNRPEDYFVDIPVKDCTLIELVNYANV
jgi:hypothetical protein